MILCKNELSCAKYLTEMMNPECWRRAGKLQNLKSDFLSILWHWQKEASRFYVDISGHAPSNTHNTKSKSACLCTISTKKRSTDCTHPFLNYDIHMTSHHTSFVKRKLQHVPIYLKSEQTFPSIRKDYVCVTHWMSRLNNNKVLLWRQLYVICWDDNCKQG